MYVMATVRICGAEERCAQPSFYIPNRLDAATLQAVIKVMGGAENLAFLVEDSFMPLEPLMQVINASGSELISFNFRKSDSRTLRERLLEVMQRGLDVLYVPGRPNQSLGCLSDVPMPFMMQLAALHIAPVPVFVGFYRDDVRQTFTSESVYDRAVVRLLPKLTSGPQTGERLLQAWMEASADAFYELPLLNKSLTRLLVEGMRKYSNVELVDGMDETTLPYGKMLGVAMAFARWIKKNVTEPRVGVILPPGKGGVLTNYACLLAGVVPVNINYTSSDAAFAAIVRQSGIKQFITARAFMSKLPQFPWPKNDQIIHLDRTLKGIGMAKIAYWVGVAKVAPMPVIAKLFDIDKRKGDDEAALLFTSGSSGEPKGVSMTHRMLVANMCQLLSKVNPPVGSAFLASLPIFHSFGLNVTTMLPPVFGYGMVTYPSPLDAKRLNELIEKYKCSLVVTTPTFARGMLRRATPHNYDSVQYFVTGAEKLQ